MSDKLNAKYGFRQISNILGKSSQAVIEKSLVANRDEDLLFMLKQSFECYHYLQSQEERLKRKLIKTQSELEKVQRLLKECT